MLHAPIRPGIGCHVRSPSTRTRTTYIRDGAHQQDRSKSLSTNNVKADQLLHRHGGVVLCVLDSETWGAGIESESGRELFPILL